MYRMSINDAIVLFVFIEQVSGILQQEAENSCVDFNI